jgi:hypothetical protein
MLNGACLCGRIQYEISSEPRFMYQCFCGKCRAASGASFVTSMIVDADSFRITAGQESLRPYESGGGQAALHRPGQCRLSVRPRRWVLG